MKIHLKHQEIAPRCCSVFSLRKGHCAFCPWRSVEVKNDPQQYSDKELAADVDKRRAGLLALKHLPVVIEGEQEAANPADALASAGWEAAGTADGRDFIRCPFCLRTHIVQSFAYRIVNEEDNLCTATTCACFDNENSSNIYILIYTEILGWVALLDSCNGVGRLCFAEGGGGPATSTHGEPMDAKDSSIKWSSWTNDVVWSSRISSLLLPFVLPPTGALSCVESRGRTYIQKSNKKHMTLWYYTVTVMQCSSWALQAQEVNLSESKWWYACAVNTRS